MDAVHYSSEKHRTGPPRNGYSMRLIKNLASRSTYAHPQTTPGRDVAKHKLKVQTRFRYGKRSYLYSGDRFRSGGGPVYVGKDDAGQSAPNRGDATATKTFAVCRDMLGRRWHGCPMATSTATLELRTVPLLHSPVIAKLEQEIGRPLTHEQRHYLAGHPVYCGDMLEIYADHGWVFGRFEWTANSVDEPLLVAVDRVFWLNGSQLLRWPEPYSCVCRP